MYKIEFSHSAAKELENIYKKETKLYFRLLNAIEPLKINPYQGKALKGKLKGLFSLRVGDYRVIYSINKSRLIIFIIDLGHRREIYR